MKRFIAILVTVLFFFQSVPLIPTHAHAAFDGTHVLTIPDGYIGVYTASDLDMVRNNLSGHYILMNDIDLTDATAEGGDFYHNGAGWNPIGNDTTPFTGIFDGNGYKIIGMKIHITSDQTTYGGLFGYAVGAEFKNIGVVDGNVQVDNHAPFSTTAYVYVGSVLGSGTSIKITNCFNTGDIKSTSPNNSYAGGIVGNLGGDSTVSGCYNTGNVYFAYKGGGITGLLYSSTVYSSSNTGAIISIASNSTGGGLVGYAGFYSVIRDSFNEGEVTGEKTTEAGGIAGILDYHSSVVHSYNTGNVTSHSFTGGIAGFLSSSLISKTYNAGTINGFNAGGIAGELARATVTDSYNIGEIIGDSYVGGIAGDSTDTTIKNTYNVGTISLNHYSDMKGGIAGNFDRTIDGTILNSYYLNNLTDSVTIDGTYAKSFDEMKTSSTYAGFDFNSVWTMDENSAYRFPILSGLPPLGREEVLAISLKTNPKLIYTQGDDFDVTGGVITAWTNFGNYHDVNLQPDMVIGYDKNLLGYHGVTIKYQNYFLYLRVRVDVKDITPPSIPDVDAVTEHDTIVTGSAEAGSMIEIQANGAVIGSGTTGSDGNFTIHIPSQSVGTVLTITAADQAGNGSPAAIVVVKDGTPPVLTLVNEVTDHDTVVTGEAEPGTVIKIFFYTGLLASGKTGTDGKFSVEIPVLRAGTPLDVAAFDEAGNESTVISIRVKDLTAPFNPTVYVVTDQSTVVEGTGEPDTTINISVGNTIIASGTVGTDGHFSIDIPVQKAGLLLVVTSIDKAGNRSSSSVEVQDVTAPVKPVVNSVTSQDSLIEGQAEPGTIIEISIDTSIINRTTAGADGHFTARIPLLTAGTNIIVTSTDARGYISPQASVIVKAGTLKGWVQSAGNWYYYNPSTIKLVTGWLKWNQKWYYFDRYGVMQTGWEMVSGKWYYLDANGAMKTGWLYTGGKWYYLNPGGDMKIGWLSAGGKWYYLEASGAMKTGWLYTGGKWYYFYSSGVMAANITVNGYRFDKNGVWIR